MFTDHTLDKKPKCDTYLRVTWPTHIECFGVDDDAELDLLTLLNAAYSDCTIELSNTNYSTPHAAIITDGNPIDSVVVWQSSDFFIDPS